jgi:integrase
MGMTYKRGTVWWVKYYRNGIPMRESSGSPLEEDAKRLLRTREGDLARGIPVTPRVGRIRFDELAEDVVNDYQVNGKRSLGHLKRRLKKHLTPFFAGRFVSAITTAEIRKYIVSRQKAGASNAEINRELAALKRAFNLAVQAGKLFNKPHVPMLRENNVRKGFFEREQFEGVRCRLTEAVQAVVTFAYVTGWRIPSEVLRLQWRQVDFETGEVRLDPGTTKNTEGRVFPFTRDLCELLEAEKAKTDALRKQNGIICPWVLHRRGRPVRSFRSAWAAACTAAGVPGRIPHDFRRTAVRNLVRAGIPERVAMQMTGHKTRSVFERYNIVSEGDLRAAAARLDEVAGTIPGTIAPSAAKPAASLTTVSS